MEIISVAKASCLPVWKTAGEKILEWVPADLYRVIVPESDTGEFQNVSNNRFQVESELLHAAYLREALIEAIPAQNKGRMGWYFQQFIKLEYVKRAADAGRDAIIWDADTIPLAPIEPFDSAKVRFFPGKEYHLPYFKTIEIALGLDKLVGPSFVAQSFPVKAAWATSFFEELENRNSLPWWAALIESIDFERKSGFSEYETLGTFISHKFSNQFQWDHRKWTRRGYEVFGQPDRVNDAQTRGDFVFAAFEQSDRAKKGTNSALENRKFPRLRRSAVMISRSLSAKRYIKNVIAEHDTSQQLHVLQIGISSKRRMQFGLTRLGRKGCARIEIIEPRSSRANKLSRLAQGQDFVNVRDLLAGARDELLPVYWLDTKWWRQIAPEFRGILSSRDYLSTLRAPLIWQWAQTQSLLKKRGESLRDAQTAIRRSMVKVEKTSTLLTSNPEDTFLIIDVSGIEVEALEGLELDHLPRWVSIVKNPRDRRALTLLQGLGYEIRAQGARLIFERMK